VLLWRQAALWRRASSVVAGGCESAIKNLHLAHTAVELGLFLGQPRTRTAYRSLPRLCAVFFWRSKKLTRRVWPDGSLRDASNT
jgi:hypothetical protein